MRFLQVWPLLVCLSCTSSDDPAPVHAAGTGAGEGGAHSAAGEGAPAAGKAGSAAGSGKAGAPAAGSGGAGQGGTAAGSGGAQARCGTRAGARCAAGEFCDFAPDVDCGATDRGGACRAKTDVCDDLYAPVCGCDNRTYSSECVAHREGVSVKRDGMCGPDECTAASGHIVTSDGASTPECPAGEDAFSISGGREATLCCVAPKRAGKTCGGIAALECGTGEFCNSEQAAGGQGCDGMVADAGGTCQSIPMACTREYMPVCGCDHKTYATACVAHGEGVAVLHDGACP